MDKQTERTYDAMIGVGIDFGTSNSAAACYDGVSVQLIELEPRQGGEGSDIMPTATHIDRDLQTSIGESAVEQYIEDNRDRIVELTPEVIGKGQLLINEASANDPQSQADVATQNVYGAATIDRGMPGRLFRGVKRLLGNPGIKRLLVFDKPFRVVALITPILLHIRQRLEISLPEPLGNVHFGHPVLFEGNNEFRNDVAFARLKEATDYAGYQQLNFYPEPVAATLSYLHDRFGSASESDLTVAAVSNEKGKVLTLDFGGGTLDLSVIEFQGLNFKVLSTAGLSLGGDHIDQLIFKELLFPLLGKGELWSRIRDGQLVENEFPFDEFEDKLLNWAVTYTLNQNYYRAKLAECIGAGGAAAAKFERLDDLITHNHSYLVFQAIKDAKAALSSVEETILDVPELDISIPFNRSLFEKMMTGMLAEIDLLLDQVLARANCDASDIDVVIRTGGSSQIAAVRRLLESRFPDKVTEHDPFTSVAAGLAIASYHGYEFAS